MALRIGAGIVDPSRREVVGPHGMVALSELELALLTRLGKNPNTTVSRETLLVEVFGYAPASTSRTIYTTISRLRNRMKEAGLDDTVLQSVYGQGYRLQMTDPLDASWIGREEEMGTLHAWWMCPAGSAMVLVGPGGMGKTTLARGLQAATTRTAFCDLRSARDRSDVLFRLARVLGLDHTDAIEGHIAQSMAGPPFLLVLDNAEHLTDVVAELAAGWLKGNTTLKVLITSRTELTLPRSNRLVIGPMTPAAAERLFRESAAELAPGVSLSGDLPRLLAGLEYHPLSVRLAASRLRVLSVDQLIASLDRRLEILQGQAETPRHRDLGAMLQTSLDALNGPQAEGLVAAAELPGPFSVERLHTVLVEGVAEDILQHLVEAHLVQREDTRFDLHAFVREAVLAQAPPSLQMRIRVAFLDAVQQDVLDAERRLEAQPPMEELLYALRCAVDLAHHEHAAVVLSGLAIRTRLEQGGVLVLTERLFDPPEGLSLVAQGRVLAVRAALARHEDLRLCLDLASKAVVLCADGPVGLRYEAHLARAHALACLGRRKEALEEVENLAAFAGAAREPRWRFHFAVDAMDIDLVTHAHRSVIDIRDRFVPLEPVGTLSDRLWFRAIESDALAMLGERQEALESSKAAWALVERASVPPFRRDRVLLDIGWFEAENGNCRQACQILEDLEAQSHPGNLWVRMRAVSNRVFLRAWLLDWDEARSALALLSQLECVVPQRVGSHARGMLRWYQGFVGDLDSRPWTPDRESIVGQNQYFIPATHLAQAGDLTGALTQQREHLRTTELPDSHPHIQECKANLAELLGAQGEFGEADAIWHEVFATSAPRRRETPCWRAAWHAAQARTPAPHPGGILPYAEMAAACWNAVGHVRRGHPDRAVACLLPVEAAMKEGSLPPTSMLGWRLGVARRALSSA